MGQRRESRESNKRNIENQIPSSAPHVTGRQWYAQSNGFPKYKKNNLRREAESGLCAIICVPYGAVGRTTQVPRALRHLVSPRVSTRHTSHISVTLRTSSLIPLPSTFPSLRGRGSTPLLAPYSSLTLAGLGLTYSGGYDPLIPTYPRYPQALGPQTIVHDSL
jgi:hypothetical protein